MTNWQNIKFYYEISNLIEKNQTKEQTKKKIVF